MVVGSSPAEYGQVLLANQPKKIRFFILCTPVNVGLYYDYLDMIFIFSNFYIRKSSVNNCVCPESILVSTEFDPAPFEINRNCVMF